MLHKLVLSSELSVAIDQILTNLRNKIYPDCIVLTDISGQLISFYAKTKEVNIENLAALFASNMGATTEIAQEVMEVEGFDFNLHEGKHSSVFISKIGQSFLLAVVFHSSEQIGLIRLFTKRACQEIVQLTEQFETEMSARMKVSMNDTFSDELSRQFMGILESKGKKN